MYNKWSLFSFNNLTKKTMVDNYCTFPVAPKILEILLCSYKKKKKLLTDKLPICS